MSTLKQDLGLSVLSFFLFLQVLAFEHKKAINISVKKRIMIF